MFVAFVVAWAEFTAGAEVIDWSEIPDLLEIRMETGAKGDFYKSCEFNDEADSNEQIVSYLNSEDWESAAASAEVRLQACPVDITMHMYAAIALAQLRRVSEAQQHTDWYRGLIVSVLDSGDGKTPENAFVTISVDEEYAVLRALGLRVTSQSLAGDRDRFVVTDEAGDEHVIYFYPELHWKRMSKMFGD